jgi:hypothetical protein
MTNINDDFLDKVAIETMKIYLVNKQPQSYEDSLSIARISYKQAQAMLEAKEWLNNNKNKIS